MRWLFEDKNLLNNYKQITLDTLKLKNTYTVLGRIIKVRDHGKKRFLKMFYNFQELQVVLNDNITDNIVRGSIVKITGRLSHRDIESDKAWITKNTTNLEILEQIKTCTQYDEIFKIKSHLKSLSINDAYELQADKIDLVIVPKVPHPFDPFDNKISKLSEDLSHKYRGLYLLAINNNLKMRAQLFQFTRDFIHQYGFTEIHTPLMTSSSPEGARDFVIPSRLHLNKYYALPQSPQIFKQILMVGGIGRYYSLAPCFRDEDARRDRLYGEFYQFDLEAECDSEDHIIELGLKYIKSVLNNFDPTATLNVQTMSFDTAILKYGVDKPDLLMPSIILAPDFVTQLNIFSQYKYVKSFSMPLDGFNVKSRKELLDIVKKAYVQRHTTGLFEYISYQNQKFSGVFKKLWKENIIDPKDQITIFAAGNNEKKISIIIGKIRANMLTYIRDTEKHPYSIVTIKNFPMYEMKDNKITFMHNPFSKPIKSSTSDILDTKSHQFDFIINGYEIASGSLRNTDIDSLINGFITCGHNFEDVNHNFRAIIKSFEHGVHPHAGMALGLERLLSIILRCKNIRDTVAFPMNAQGRDTFTNAPNELLL